MTTIINQRTAFSRTHAALFIVALCFLTVLTPTQAFAKSCRNVHLEVRNKTSKPIKIIDVDYWDGESEKWRSEPVANEVIKKGLAWQENRNLEHVNNQRVKIRVEYRKSKWNKLLKRWHWSMKKSRYISKAKKCTKNTDFIMTLR